MIKNEEKDFDINLKEIKELSEKLKESMEGNITILYHNEKNNIMKYRGGYVDKKYEGRGTLYDYKGAIIYNGYFLNNEYNEFGNEFKNNKLIYEGFYINGKKNGKGILYYDDNEKIYFNGIFEMDNYVEGILFAPNGEKIYEGLFMNNNPKEGNNFKIYRKNGMIEYEGDILNGQYQGHGILYGSEKIERIKMISELKFSKYVGEFKNHKFNGQGQFYLKDHLLG